jgi:hypothetical protein
MLSSVKAGTFRRGDHSSKESYRLRKKDYENEEGAKAQQRAVMPMMNQLIFIMKTCRFMSRSENDVPSETILDTLYQLMDSDQWNPSPQT